MRLICDLHIHSKYSRACSPQMEPEGLEHWARLKGIDIVVPDQETPRADKLAIAGLLPGTELTMTDCTLTLAAK